MVHLTLDHFMSRTILRRGKPHPTNGAVAWKFAICAGGAAGNFVLVVKYSHRPGLILPTGVTLDGVGRDVSGDGGGGRWGWSPKI